MGSNVHFVVGPVNGASFLRVATALLLVAAAGSAEDWPQFRGTNGSGVSESTRLPVEFGPGKNVVWQTAVPPRGDRRVCEADWP